VLIGVLGFWGYYSKFAFVNNAIGGLYLEGSSRYPITNNLGTYSFTIDYAPFGDTGSVVVTFTFAGG
jgi:hypothetical protein